MRWILNWLRRRQRRRQRDIFRFFNGHHEIGVDPMRVHRELELHPNFQWELGFAVDEGDVEAIAIVSGAVQDVFGVQPWDPETETGLIDAECIAILFEYSNYVEEVKKKSGLGLTSSPASESEPLTEQEAESSTTSCDSA